MRVNERELVKIANYLSTCGGVVDGCSYRKEVLEKLSYREWAIGEILNRVYDSPCRPARDTVFLFATEMNVYMRHSLKKKTDSYFMFLVARDVAESLLKTL